MKKRMMSVLLVLSVAMVFASCGQSQETASVSTADDPNVFSGTYFTIDRLEGAPFTQTGNDFSRSNENGLISVRAVPLPGITASDAERTRSVLDGFSGGMIDISVTSVKVDGKQALMMAGKKNDVMFKYVSLALSDAVCIISNEPASNSNESDFNRVLESFKVKNSDYFKGSSGTTPGTTTKPTQTDTSQKPQTYKNDYYSFSTPQEWEITPGDNGSCLITPLDASSQNVMQGISIDVMPKHNRESDLAYAQVSGSKPTSVTYGANTYAQFYIAIINTYNFIVTKGDKTYMIAVTSSSDQLSEKVKMFLKTLVFK